jgi:acetylornithine deacetylase (ArgE)
MTANTPDLMTMLRTLIAVPSVSSLTPTLDQDNRPIINLLASWLEDLGYRIEILPVPKHPGKANLIAARGDGPEGLVLSGHTDTVPYDEGRWRYDPFVLTEADNRLYGLGTSDMKAFLALAIEAMRAFRDVALSKPLIFLATADEESSMRGARALVDAGRPQARYAIIGEPTGLRPVRVHKGILMEAIHLKGRSGHSSDPSLGVSALEGMGRVIDELIAWRGELQVQHHHPLFKVPTPTLNLGRIQGGDNPNRICAECELQIDLRFLPGMNPAVLRASLKSRLEHLLADSELILSVKALFPAIPAFETEANSPIVRAAQELTGHAPGAVAFGTEGPFFKALGMETVILGPGNIEQAHQPNEYLGLNRIQPTIDILKQLIQRFCIDSLAAS